MQLPCCSARLAMVAAFCMFCYPGSCCCYEVCSARQSASTAAPIDVPASSLVMQAHASLSACKSAAPAAHHRCCVVTTIVLYDSRLWIDDEARGDLEPDHTWQELVAASAAAEHLQGLAFVDCQVSTGTVLPGELLNFLPSLR